MSFNRELTVEELDSFTIDLSLFDGYSNRLIDLKEPGHVDTASLIEPWQKECQTKGYRYFFDRFMLDNCCDTIKEMHDTFNLHFEYGKEDRYSDHHVPKYLYPSVLNNLENRDYLFKKKNEDTFRSIIYPALRQKGIDNGFDILLPLPPRPKTDENKFFHCVIACAWLIDEYSSCDYSKLGIAKMGLICGYLYGNHREEIRALNLGIDLFSFDTYFDF